MSTEQNKAVLRRWMEGWNTRDVDVIATLVDETFAADLVIHSFQPNAPGGREDIRQFVRNALKNRPDIQITIEDMVAEGDRVAIRFTVGSTNTLTGKPTYRHIDVFRFADDKIAEEWAAPSAEITASTAAGEAHDPVAVVKALDAACNAGDIDRVMTLFAADASLKDPVEPKVYTGKQQIREWFEPQLGHIHVTSTNHRVTGNTVTWLGTLTGDIVKQMGSEVIEETAEAVVHDGKITSFALTVVGRKP